MATFKLSIEMDNEAFEDDPLYEVSRILEVVQKRLAGGTPSGTLRDLNGNTVGEYVVKP